MGLETLKAQAYDTLAQIEMLQNRLRQINNAIAMWKEPVAAGQPTEEKKEETPPAAS